MFFVLEIYGFLFFSRLKNYRGKRCVMHNAFSFIAKYLIVQKCVTNENKAWKSFTSLNFFQIFHTRRSDLKKGKSTKH